MERCQLFSPAICGCLLQLVARFCRSAPVLAPELNVMLKRAVQQSGIVSVLVNEVVIQ